MKQCPICKTANMTLVARYEFPSSSAERWQPSGGTVSLEGSVSFPDLRSKEYVVYWKCPNCGWCTREKMGNEG